MADKPVLSIPLLFRLLSTRSAKMPLTKYNKQRGIASNVIVTGSGVGVKDAVNTKQGYLFPDTYFISPFALASDVVQKMNDNFNHHLRGLEKNIASSGHTEQEIITMASIIEKESNGKGDRALISGILWNRIRKGVRLQVDASLTYLLGKESKNLTLSDLKTDSPYNTYVHTGLPPGPICNPGIESIKAALYPAQTNDMFYLHGPDGTFHGAVTFAEHVKNKNLYLR